jgi:ATP-binding cassette, subfamily G (WHITE), member 2, PDR
MVPASVLMLALLIFTGFVVPIDYMLGWCRWINYVNPVAYGYEALMVNEFHGRNFSCSTYIPDYADVSAVNAACATIGSIPGQPYVNGDDYINSAYSYFHNHKWRNVGIIAAMAVFNHLVYFIGSEYVTAKKSKGEVLVFRRGFVPPSSTEGKYVDVEKSLSHNLPAIGKSTNQILNGDGGFTGSTSVFHWSNVCYDLKIKRETRRILDHVDGWIKPGSLTALMGVSGAGKTTLLDCLADRRVGVGVITGAILVDGKMRDESFQRKTGYAQQHDLHLETTTVREVRLSSVSALRSQLCPKATFWRFVRLLE